MNWTTSLVVVVLGVLAGSVLFSMVGHWVLAIVAAVKIHRAKSARERHLAPLAVLGMLFFHSGPWALVVAGTLAYFIFSRAHAGWWLWFFAGACAAPVLLSAAALVGRFRKVEAAAIPWTPERLRRRRRRSILVLVSGWLVVMLPNLFPILRALSNEPWKIGVLVSICVASAFLFALVFWQWEKSLLLQNERERQQAGSP